MARFCFCNASGRIMNHAHGLSWMGKHLVLSYKNNPSLKRLYTNVLSLTDDNIKLRISIFNYFIAAQASSQFPEPFVAPLDIHEPKKHPTISY